MKHAETTLLTIAAIFCAAMVLILLAGTGRAQPVSPAVPAVQQAGPVDSGSLLMGADNDFRSGRFAQAAASLRQVIGNGHADGTVWAYYRRAVLAAAGDAYLQAVPQDRLRIRMAAFVNSLKTAAGRDFLLDVREPWEFARGNIPGSVNIPFRDLFNHLPQLPRPESGKRLVIICQTQHRANHVLVTLRQAGFSNAFTLQGGYSAYVAYHRRTQLGTSGKTAVPPSAAAGSGVKTVPSPTPSATVATPAKTVNQEAATAVKNGRFALAVAILRQALKQDAGNQELWRQYDQALVLEAGAMYLCMVPDNRHRVDIGDFVSQYRTHGRRFFLVDVREPAEFAKSHITGAVNIPFRTLLHNLNRLPQRDSSKILLLVSQHQRRAIHDLVILRQLGYDNAFTLHGGLSDFVRWMKKLPGISGSAMAVPGFNQLNGSEGEEEEEEDFGC